MARTKTQTSHWHVQWERRNRIIEEWERTRRKIVRERDLEWVETPRGLREAMYMGADVGAPTRVLDATIAEIDPGVRSHAVRHSWDAILFVTEGWGWSEVDGVRYDWGPWDAIHIPAWSWHRHGNDGDRRARFLSSSSEPLISVHGLGFHEDGGDRPTSELPPAPSTDPDPGGEDWYSRRLTRIAGDAERRRQARIHTDYDEIELQVNPKGTRSKFLNDPSIGNFTTGLTQVMTQYAPGYHQSMHRHPGEAWLYVVEGRGHSYVSTEPTGGQEHAWEKGDLVVVDHWQWHQHFNDDPDNPARLMRIHMFDSHLESMRLLMRPLELFEEKLETAPDIGNVTWPEDVRPR